MDSNQNHQRPLPLDRETPTNEVDPRLIEVLRAALEVVASQQLGNNGLVAEERNKAEKKAEKKPEEQIPLFWKLCSAALVSVSALIAVTLYNQLSNQLNALRSDMGVLRTEFNSLRERSNHDLVRKEEHDRRNVAIAALIEKVQASTKANLDAWKERNQDQEKAFKGAQANLERIIKEQEREIQQMRERLAVLEQRDNPPRPAKK